MLIKLHYLYQKSAKRLRERREFATAYEGGIPKPTKATGTRWIEHKYKVKNVSLLGLSSRKRLD